MQEENKYENILYAKKEKVATITLNRQKSLNALNTALLTELRDALDDAETDAAVRAIVITGAGGKAFCAGADITELVEKNPEEASEWSRWAQGITTYMGKLSKPIIAKINGFCLGGKSGIWSAGDKPGNYPGWRRHTTTTEIDREDKSDGNADVWRANRCSRSFSVSTCE
jgi:enoyl-CoA hydratase/carnithine racemase